MTWAQVSSPFCARRRTGNTIALLPTIASSSSTAGETPPEGVQLAVQRTRFMGPGAGRLIGIARSPSALY
jgi:hypothetical protein